MQAKVIVFLLLFFSSIVSAATLEGKVASWGTLQPLDDAVIDFNSIPHQRIISREGAYRVALEPSVYQIQAVYYVSGKPELYALEEIEIREQGNYVFDLILFPISDADLNRLKILGTGTGEKKFDYWVILILLILIILFLFLRKKKEIKQEKIIEATEPKTETPEKQMDKYAMEVLDVLKRSGNRLTQKELREQVSVGEAKVSLIVTELEEMGLVKKIKQGRGNIIVLKEKT